MGSQPVQRQQEGVRHLVGVGPQPVQSTGLHTGQHRVHQRVGAEVEEIQQADDADVRRINAQLLPRLPQGAVGGRLARLHPPAGEADLVGLADAARAYLVQQAQALLRLYQWHQHGVFPLAAQKPRRMVLIGVVKIPDIHGVLLLYALLFIVYHRSRRF